MQIEEVDIDKLLLDPNNSRFAELYSDSKKEKDLVEYLLYTEAAAEVAENIVTTNQFYPDEALWVTPQKDKFLVKDGNRRFAAVKALQNPSFYGLDLPQVKIEQMPVLIYKDKNELNRRINEQHTHSLFREWERIAKALRVYELYKNGSSSDELREIDSDPAKLVKLASFYYEAVKIGGEDLKKLLRRGGRRAIIFERLFSFARQCGYSFKSKPSYEVEIFDKPQFQQYVESLIAYLQQNPKTTHSDVDREKATFLGRLKDYGFNSPTTSDLPSTKTSDTSGTTTSPPSTKRGSVKTRPIFTRKKIPPKLKHLIDECYSLDNAQHANAKVALARVVFETVLKYVIEETKYKGKYLRAYSHFRLAFFDKGGVAHKFTNFTKLREEFIDLITDTGTKKAFQQFDLDRLHQIIHNYMSGAGPADARTVAENLIPLVEFMLLEESDLLSGLDSKKLV